MLAAQGRTLMSRIELEFLTDNETEREICRQYWQFGDDDRFMHPVSRIAEVFSIPRYKVASRVAGVCRAFAPDKRCAICGQPRPFTSRTDYQERRGSGVRTPWTCQDCRDAQDCEARRENEQKASQRS